MHTTHWKISQPCHESVSKMDVTGRGHFCQSCQKEVINLDGKTYEDIGYKPGDDFCGSVTMPASPTVAPLSRWSSFVLRWLGVSALLFIPLKKARPQMALAVNDNNAEEKNTVSKTKRIVGTVLDENNRPLRTTVTMKDSNGNIVAETTSLANGRYLMQVDTPSIKTDTVNITAIDSPQVVPLTVTFLTNYHKDSIWIRPCLEQPYQLAGVPMSDITHHFKLPIVTTSYNIYPVYMEPKPENAGEALQQEARAGVQGMNDVSS